MKPIRLCRACPFQGLLFWLLLLLCIHSVRAADPFAPCWRGQAGTTYQDWAFNGPNNPAAPDVATNANGVGLATLMVGNFGTGWNTVSVGARTGVWDLGQAGRATVGVPNFGGTHAWKYLNVQVTYFDAPGFYLPPVVSIAGATLLSSQVVDTQPAPPGNWRTYQTVWLLQPSPGSETIVLTGDSSKGLLIDELIVDTRCAVGGDGDVVAFRPCWRGQPGTTVQQWLFGTSNNPSALPAEWVSNSFGVPLASLLPGPGSSGYTLENPALGCRQGIWDLGQHGALALSIPNGGPGAASSFEYLRVQVTQYRDAVHNANASVAIAGATMTSQQQVALETTASGGQWVVAQSLWKLGPPSPAAEAVVVTGAANGSLVDQVVVDTLAVDFTCPTNLAFNSDAGQCSKSGVTWSLPAVDGCVVTNVLSSPSSGSTFPVGTTPVSVSISDGEGGTASCSFTVTVSPTANLSVGLASWTNPAPLGGRLTSVIAVSNGGPCTATGVMLSNYLSAGQLSLFVTNGLGGTGQGCPVPGPVAWWPGAGNAQDIVGGNHGSAVGGVSFLSGEVGQSFSFDGLTGYVSVSDGAALRPASLTIEGWINPQNVSGVRVLVGKRVGTGTTDSYALWVASSVLYAAIGDNSSPGPVLSCPAPLNRWAHVAFSFDPVAQTQALYVDGVLVNASPVNHAIAYDSHPVMLGADDNQGTPGFFYQGAMDELTLYSRPLTGTEIQAIYQAGAAGKCPAAGLVALGDVPGGASVQVALVTAPTNCQAAVLESTVFSGTANSDPASATATLSVAVQEAEPGPLLLSIEPPSEGLLRMSWPLICAPTQLEAAEALNGPWGPSGAPVLMLEGKYEAMVPTGGSGRYFRVRGE